MRRRILMRLSDARREASEGAYVTDVRIKGVADPFQNIQADSLSLDQLLVGGFTDSGKGYDVALCIAASGEEQP